MFGMVVNHVHGCIGVLQAVVINKSIGHNSSLVLMFILKNYPPTFKWFKEFLLLLLACLTATLMAKK